MENKELEALKEKYADFIAALSPEDKAKVDACTTPEELLKLADETDGELPDEIVEAIAGGTDKCYPGILTCKKCGSHDVERGDYFRKCRRCGFKW